jgi:hypothetical protein
MGRSVDLNQIADQYKAATEQRTSAAVPAVLDRDGKLAVPGTVPTTEASVIPATPFAAEVR